MADATKASKTEARRSRGRGFPTASLPVAIEIIEKVGRYGRTHTAAGLTPHLGLTSDNSGSFNLKIAALKDWGFITGTREAGFSLTDGAWTVAHPVSADAKQEELIAAFRRATVFWDTYETLAKGTDLEVTAIGNLAVTKLRVAAGSKAAFVRSFVDSAITVGIAERVDSNIVKLRLVDNPESDLEVPEQPAKPGALGERSGGDDDTSLPPQDRPVKGRPVLDQEWQTAAGDVRLQIFQDNALPAKVYVQLGKVAQEIERLAAMLDSNGAADVFVSE